MPKTSIDDLLEALKSLRSLQETVGKHDKVLSRILDLLDGIDKRIAAIERSAGS